LICETFLDQRGMLMMLTIKPYILNVLATQGLRVSQRQWTSCNMLRAAAVRPGEIVAR